MLFWRVVEGLVLMWGDKGRIGFLWLVDGLNDDEFWMFFFEDVVWLMVCYYVGLDIEDLILDIFYVYVELCFFERVVDLLCFCVLDVVVCGD